MGPWDFDVRRPDDDIGEISGMGIWDGTGVVILKNGVSEALLNRVLCQTLQKCWVLEHDASRCQPTSSLRAACLTMSPFGLHSGNALARERQLARRAKQVSHDARWRCETIEAWLAGASQNGTFRASRGACPAWRLSVKMDCRDAPTAMSGVYQDVSMRSPALPNLRKREFRPERPNRPPKRRASPASRKFAQRQRPAG